MKWLTLVCLLGLPGCAAVLGYEPTPQELDAIMRGEDPRADDAPTEQPASVESSNEPRMTAGAPNTPEPVQPETAPATATVLRWRKWNVVIVETDGAREEVVVLGQKKPANAFAEQSALDRNMNDYTFGATLTLEYESDADGKPIYRDAQGRLIAKISKQ